MITCRARQLAFLPGPSSSFVSALCRSLATQTDSSNERPQMFQLDHVRSRLEFTVPLMFRQRLDYTFYRNDVICDDRIFNVKRQGLQQYMSHLGAISVTCQLLFPHIEMEALSIVPILDDGTVRLRWRVKHVSLLRALTNPMLFKYDYRVKRVMPDEERGVDSKSATQRLAEKMGVLPKGAQAASLSSPRSQI
ncbi:hypothetical protein Tcan_06825 [Toxocara canis]|uniref:Uncharacterized protein n=1 Tax=Toxocara canis TaxID=6265 RepID=A0A0B2VTU6_TOXCA|nr:hypothetical protein Tcan_06825 [Toxocara canis]